MEEWKKVKLGDILNFRRGHDLPKYNMNDGLTPVAGSNGIIGYHNEATLMSPCITIGRSGNTGTPYIYDKCWAHNTVLYIDDFKGNNPYYLYYLLKTIPLSSFSGGSAVPTLNRNHIHPIMIPHCASIKAQETIVCILSSLDNKIALNRRINDNLEQQAQALHKSWFVDFEPFKGGEFIDSELGRIPEGWKVGCLSDIGKIIGGSTPSKSHQEYYTSKGIAWLTPKDLSITRTKFTSRGEIDITEVGYKNCSTKILPKGSILFSSRAPIGYISIALNDVCTNQGFKSVIPIKEIGTAFIFYYLKTNTSQIELKASGSTFKEASGALMNSLPVIIPSINIMQKFNDIVNPIFSLQKKNEEENRTLSSARDSLLPKLMSGELKTGDLHR